MSRSPKDEVQWTRWHTRLHKTLISKQDLLPHSSCLLLAISGGQDSMTLLKLMLDLQRLHHWKLQVWHGDHGWHSQSGAIAKALKDWCKTNNLEYFHDQTTKVETKNEKEARILVLI